MQKIFIHVLQPFVEVKTVNLVNVVEEYFNGTVLTFILTYMSKRERHTI